jgi:DEAD/DEAH box helicase domain-containing protein
MMPPHPAEPPEVDTLLSNLSYIVVDDAPLPRRLREPHGELIRRIRRVARFYGANPTFIPARRRSATRRNWPSGLSASRSPSSRRTVPSGKKTVVVYNPPLVDAVQGSAKRDDGEPTLGACLPQKGR